MCVWSAYTGKREAVPLLWESLNRIEGIWGGFYTGLVTGGNQLNWRKCGGHSGIWESRFSLRELPGTCGLIHSRTASGGDDRRAHPFIGAQGEVALVSQGSYGRFSKEPFIACGNRLLAEGVQFRSAANDDSRCPVLDNGMKVCMSDVVANAVELEYMKHHDPLEAMMKVCGELAEESATIFLFRGLSDFIGYVNANQHLVYDFEDGEVFLSVSRIGLPGHGFEIPGNSAGYLTASGEFHRQELGRKYAPIDSRIPAGALDVFRDYLIQNPGTLLPWICDKALSPLFPHQQLEYRAVTAYNMLETLYFDGHIRFEPEVIQGPAGPGRIFKIYWK